MLEFDRHPGGDGGAVVLLHSLGLDRSVFDELVPFLTPRFEVFAPDLPGHGASPGIDGMTNEAIADQVADLIQDVIGEPSLVIGLSMGGCVAQALAVRHPKLVRGLGLLDTTCWYGAEAVQNWEARAQMGLDQGLASLADTQIARWFTPEFVQGNPSVVERFREVWSRTELATYAGACRAMGALDLRDAIADIEVPTAIVVGADDVATDITHAEAMRQRIPGATLQVIPNCAHLSAAEHPETVAELLDTELFARV